MIDAVTLTLTILLAAGWFRFACSLLLTAREGRDCAVEFAAVNRLRFTGVRDEAATLRDRQHLARLIGHLNRDLAVLRGLAGSLGNESPESAIERWMMSVRYRLLTLRAKLEGLFDLPRAASTILQMVEAVAFLAQLAGQRSYGVGDVDTAR